MAVAAAASVTDTDTGAVTEPDTVAVTQLRTQNSPSCSNEQEPTPSLRSGEPEPPPFLVHGVEEASEPMKELVLASESGAAVARLAEPPAFTPIHSATCLWRSGFAFAVN